MEATTNLRKLYDSSVSYFESERAQRSVHGSMQVRAFPGGGREFGMIPPAGQKCCLQPGGKCPPIREGARCLGFSEVRIEAFDALNFDLVEPFYYSYAYYADGTETEARFTAAAYGDLDCDDDWSTYKRTGSVDDRLNVVGGGLYVNNDIE